MKNRKKQIRGLYLGVITGVSLALFQWACDTSFFDREELGTRMYSTAGPAARSTANAIATATAAPTATPTARPTAIPTARPTAAPTRRPATALTATPVLPSLPTTKRYYVRPTGTTYGRGDGSDWTNALSGLPGRDHAVWRQLAGGGVLYVAGGIYNQYWELYQGGAGNEQRLQIKRATAKDHGTSNGWQAAFHSQVVINNGGIKFRPSAGYITLDGVVENGIRLAGGGNFRRVYGYAQKGERLTDITLRYLDIQGPGLNLGSAYGQSLGIQFTGQEEHAIANIVISRCRIYRFSSALVRLNKVENFLLEQSVLHDAADAFNHESFLLADGSDGTIRWNVMYNTEAQGIYIRTYGAAPWYIYGNVFYQEKAYDRHTRYSGSGGGIAITGGTPAAALPAVMDVHIFNNVFYGFRLTVKAIYTGSAYNNIFYDNYVTDLSRITHDYNWFSGSSVMGETHGIRGDNINPFVNTGAFDFHLSNQSGPINKGKDLGSTYSSDPDGKLRGQDGYWDIGSYEY